MSCLSRVFLKRMSLSYGTRLSFDTIKHTLTHVPVLAFPDYSHISYTANHTSTLKKKKKKASLMWLWDFPVIPPSNSGLGSYKPSDQQYQGVGSKPCTQRECGVGSDPARRSLRPPALHPHLGLRGAAPGVAGAVIYCDLITHCLDNTSWMLITLWLISATDRITLYLLRSCT